MDLGKFGGDSIHYRSSEIDGYQLPFNFVISPREPGKSTEMWRKIYNAYKDSRQPSIVLRRLIADIDESYVNDIETLINKFVPEEQQIHIIFKKGDIKTGITDVYLQDHWKEKGLTPFVRIIALSAPMQRLKSHVLLNVKYFMFDEFICNTRMGEKYLTNEAFRFKELFTTYNRESPKGILCYWWGNPYSLYNPYFTWLNVPTAKLHSGCVVRGEKYVVQCYKLTDELKKYILAHNPLYTFDDSYKEYGFDGAAVNDANIIIVPDQPKDFCLKYVFKLHGTYVGVFMGGYYDKKTGTEYYMWTRVMKPDEVGKRRNILIFDFGDAGGGTLMLNTQDAKALSHIKYFMDRRAIAHQTLESSYLLEEIYYNI